MSRERNVRIRDRLNGHIRPMMEYIKASEQGLAESKRHFQWPDYVYLPSDISTGGASHLIHSRTGIPTEVAEERALKIAPSVSLLGAWRMTRTVIRFPDALRDALIASKHRDAIPAQVLQRLPYWAVYLDLEGAGLEFRDEAILGAFVSLDYKEVYREEGSELPPFRYMSALVSLDYGERLESFGVPMGDLGSGKDYSIEKQIQNLVTQHDAVESAPPLFPIMNMVLYLCSMEKDDWGEFPPKPPKPRTRGKNKGRIYPAQKTSFTEVGVRVGAALKKAQTMSAESRTDTPKGKKSPHIRRAHWGLRQVGPKNRPGGPDKKLVWVSQSMVGFSSEDFDVDDIPIVIRGVA